MNISRSSAWGMWFVISIFYAYQYVLRVMPNIMMNDIMQQYAVDSAMFGQFSGIYYIGYSLMHIPLGILLDRIGPKKVIPVCMAMTALGMLPILFTNVWMYPMMGRALIGMGSSAAILGAFKIIRCAFPEDQFTRMLSLCVSVGLVGAMYGGAPVKYMCAAMGYQTVITIFAAIGACLAIVTYFITPDIETSGQPSSVISNIKEIMSSPKVIIVCILSGFMVGPLEGFADVWSCAFFTYVYGLTQTVATSLPSAIFLGMCFGGPILSLIADTTKSYLGTTAIAGLVMALIFTILVAGIMPVVIISPAFFIVGICCAYQIIAIYKASTYVSPQAMGLTTAVANMIIMSFGYPFHATIGYMVNSMGGIYNAQALIYGISIIPVMLVIGSAGFIVVAVHDRMQEHKSVK